MFQQLYVQVVHFILGRFCFILEFFLLKKVIAKLFLQHGGQLVPFYPWKISNQLGETSGALKCVLNVIESERRLFLYFRCRSPWHCIPLKELRCWRRSRIVPVASRDFPCSRFYSKTNPRLILK